MVARQRRLGMIRVPLVILVCVALLADGWQVVAAPSTALVLRVPRQAPASAFGDLTSNDTSVAISLQPNAPWEEFIMPSPTIIALLGQLMVISGKVDFSLKENAPRDGFKYMKYPESFRASLVQVSNDGWNAFMNAQKNMDKIQLYMQQVPVQVRAAIKILSTAPSNAIKLLLPISLNRIQEISTESVKLSSETENKFADVMLLLGELLAVTESSKGTHEQQLAEVQAELNVTAEQKKSIEELGRELKKKQDDIDAEVAKRRADYDSALKSIPTGWTAIAQDLGRAVVNIVNIIPAIFKDIGEGGGGGGGSSVPGSTPGRSAGDFERSSAMAQFRNFFDYVGRAKSTVLDVFNGKNKPDQKPSDMLAALNVVLNTFEKGFKDTKSDVTSAALGFVNDGKALYQQIEGMMKDFPAKSINASEQSQLAGEFDSLLDKMKSFDAQASAMTGGLSTGQGGVTGGGDGGGQYSCTGCNERYKANLALQALEDSRQQQDKVFGDVMKYYEEMKELVGKMAKLKLEEINYKDILVLLKQGIQLLAKIRAQWGKLVQFFTLVSVRAEVALNATLGPFLQYAQAAEQMIGQSGGASEDRKFYIDMLEDQAVDINRISYFLYILSSTYFDVSTRFLTNRLAGLAQMLATDSEAERQKLLVDLNNQADEAQDAIKEMAQQRRLEYTRLVDARKIELQKLVDQYGAPTEAEAKAIESAYPTQKS